MYYNYNYNSPNNYGMMGQSNIMPIGNNGYNNYGYNGNYYNDMGGYYNGIYDNMYNPFEIARQQKYEEEMWKKQIEADNLIMKEMIKGCYHALNVQVDDSFVDECFEPPKPKEIDIEIQRNQELAQIINDPNTTTVNPEVIENINAWNRIYDETKQKYPDSMGVEEFFDNSGHMYAELIDREQRIRERNLAPLYNSNQYNQLLDSRGGITYLDRFNSNKEISIDDIEVGLASKAVEKLRTIKKQRQKFIDSIIN